MGLDADDGKHITVVVCLDPPEAYANKDQKHLGFIVAAKLVPDPKAEAVSEREHTLIIRAVFALKVALENIQVIQKEWPF
jgi:hypothetical protein